MRWMVFGVLVLGACDDGATTERPPHDMGIVDVAAPDVLPGDASPPDAGALDATPADAAPEMRPDAGPPGPDFLGAPCPPEGRARATVLAAKPEVSGRRVVADVGDLALVNRHAAFIITQPDATSTYYHYGGILADAFAVRDCAQASDEAFEELGVMVGQIELADFTASTLRAFQAQSVEILSDGSDGGDAVVRMTGVDAPYWLVEYTLQRARLQQGAVRMLTEQYGVRMQVDYRLPPDSNTLVVDVEVTNEAPEPNTLVLGAIMTFGDTQEIATHHDNGLSIGGFELDMGIPWLSTTDGAGAYAFAWEAANMAYIRISGVDVALDVNRILARPLRLAAAGEEGDSDAMRMFVAVGDGDANTAIRGLHVHNPTPLPNGPYVPAPLSGIVLDDDGAPVAGAVVHLEAQSQTRWGTLDRLFTDADGRFSGELPDFGARFPTRLVARIPGRDDSAPLPWAGEAEATIVAPPSGQVRVQTRDAEGPIPTRILLRRADGARRLIHARGADVHPIPPGTWSARVTRGIEYPVVDLEVIVPPNGEALLEAELVRAVDTAGYLSADTHVHSDPSADSRVLIADRLLTAAGAGLEVIVATDHEIITDMRPFLDGSGLEPWVNTVIGQELTATVPEHLTTFPLVPDDTPRTGIVPWYQLDIDTLFEAARDRGAEVIVLNHPIGGCNYLCLIEWDFETNTAGLESAAPLGLAEDAPLWSWNFDAVEFQNDAEPIFRAPGRLDTGHFEVWQNWHNAGRRITALGSSDVHGVDGVGFPRSYFRAPTDAPADFEPQMLVDAVKSGAVVVSSGAFLRVEHEGQDVLGRLVSAEAGTVLLDLRVEAMEVIDVTRVVVFANCDQVLEFEADDPNGVVKFVGAAPIELAADTQITVMAFGERPMPAGFPQYNATLVPRVTANPVFVDTDGNGVFDPPGPKTCEHDQAWPGR